MTIREGSRYDGAAVLRVKDHTGTARPTIYAVVPGGFDVDYSTHVVVDGERFDQIAYRLWGDPTQWWRIANLNPELLYPADIPAGTIIRVPLR